MVIFIVGATVVGFIGYILLSDPKIKDRKKVVKHPQYYLSLV